MADKTRVHDYLVSVAGCIRWKRARGPLLQELSDHIADQEREFTALGMVQEEAEERAILEMGDPETVGRELDRLHRPKTSWGLIIITVMAVGMGLLLLPSSARFFDPMRQLLVLLCALPVVVFLAMSDFSLLIRKKWLLAAAYMAIFFYLALSTRRLIGGVAHYMAYGVMLFPLLFAATLCRLRGKGAGTVLLCSLGALALALTGMVAPNLSAVLITLGVMLLTLGFAVWRGWFKVKRPVGLLCAWGPSLLFLATVLLRHGAWFAARFSYVFHPEQDPLGKGWFAMQVREFLENAPWIGTSGGQAYSRYFFLLEPDFVPLRLSAAFGKIALPLLGLLLLVLAWAVAARIRKVKSVSGQLVACAAAGTMLLQALANLTSMLLPGLFSRTSLPFLSYGPAFLFLDLLLVAALFSVFRMDALVRDVAEHKGTLTLSVPGLLRIPLGPWSIHIEKREKE